MQNRDLWWIPWRRSYPTSAIPFMENDKELKGELHGELIELRNEIDAIDKEIVGLFQKRMKISSKVAEYKNQYRKKRFDRAREEEKPGG